MQRDSIANTLTVAVVLCVVCSVLVSGSAVGLRNRQETNKLLDKRTNVLLAAGLITAQEASDQRVQQIFDERIENELIELATGEAVQPDDVDFDIATFDALEAARSDDLGVAIAPDDDIAGIKRRAKYAMAYRVNGANGELSQLVVPIYGKGLWSTLYGFLALEADLNTVSGITFYQHGETPGLGGEIENKRWQASWHGKETYGEEGDVAISVVKGTAAESGDAAKHEIDGLSGATITSRGVTDLIRYWLGPSGFEPYLRNLRGAREGGGPV
jgi:Na+-transporting NADH:ubiquinone oxidoreductase subunit C